MHVEKADNLSNMSGYSMPNEEQSNALKVYGEVRETIMGKQMPNQLLDWHKKSNEEDGNSPKNNGLGLLNLSSRSANLEDNLQEARKRSFLNREIEEEKKSNEG